MTKISISNLQPQDNSLIDIKSVNTHAVIGGCGYCLYSAPVYSPPVYSPPVYSPPVYIPACTY
jgi:hypothetical protein